MTNGWKLYRKDANPCETGRLAALRVPELLVRPDISTA